MSLKAFFQKMMCSNSRKDDFTEEQTTARSALPVEPKALEVNACSADFLS